MAIVPAFNEQGSLAETLDDLRCSPHDIEIVVINDGSTDLTGEIAHGKEGVTVLDLPVQLGIGGAVQTGLRYFLKSKCEFVFQFDGDGQHRGGEISTLLNSMTDDTAMVVGSRFVKGERTYEGSKLRRVGISILDAWIKVLTGLTVTDATSGFRMYRRKTIETLVEQYPDDFPEPVVAVILARRKAKITEVPVRMNQRAGGASSLRGFVGGYYMAKVVVMMLLARLGGKTGG